MSNACATCARTFGGPPESVNEKSILPGRCLECCGRQICLRCLHLNKRYETYCPHCQITGAPSPLPQGLKEPPAYSSLDRYIPSSTANGNDELPAYSASQAVEPPFEKSSDVLHFLRQNDTIASLSLAYGVPTNILRRANHIFSDHLIQARKTMLIPGEYCQGGVSLSPQPVEGEEQEIKKNKLRRWMVACKVAEYDVATMYLQQNDWSLDLAIEAFKDDEQWEKEHPLESTWKTKGKSAKSAGIRRFVGSRGNDSIR